MKLLTLLCLLLLLLPPLLLENPLFAAEASQPNIVYLLVDDLGWSVCGFMGCNDIRMPHINDLVFLDPEHQALFALTRSHHQRKAHCSLVRSSIRREMSQCAGLSC